MNGLNSAAGGGTTVKLNGETLVLGNLTIDDFALVENHLVANRPNLIRIAAEAVKDLSPELADRVLDRAMARAQQASKVTPQETAEWLDTRAGVSFTIWIMLNKSYPNRWKLENIDSIISKMEDGEVQDLIDRRDQAATINKPGNVEGQAQSEVPSQSTGDGSSTT